MNQPKAQHELYTDKKTIISLVVIALVLGFSLKARLFSLPQETMDIPIYSRNGELDRLRLILRNSRQPTKLVNSFDDRGMTPLMLAIQSPDASIEVARLLLDNGADVNAVNHGGYDEGRPVLSYALSAGDPQKTALLFQLGTTVGTAAGYSGIAEFRLVRVAPGFSLGPADSTATEEQVAQWLVARIRPEGQKSNGSGQIQPEILRDE